MNTGKRKIKLLLAAGGLMVLGIGLMLMTRLPVLGLETAGFCGRCHAMDSQVESYFHSAHREDVTCGDCHDPHGLMSGSVYAAYTGTRDVYRVVSGTIPPEITATGTSQKVIQGNCLRCHGEMLGEVGDTSRGDGMYCFDCHRRTPHNK